MNVVSFPQKKSQLLSAAKLLIKQGNYFAGVALLRRANTAAARFLTACTLSDMGMIIPSCEELYSLLAKGVYVKQCMKALQDNFEMLEDNLRTDYYSGEGISEEVFEERQEGKKESLLESEKEMHEYIKSVTTLSVMLSEEKYALASELAKESIFKHKDDLQTGVLALKAFYLNGEKDRFDSVLRYFERNIDKETNFRAFCEIGMALGNLGLHKKAYDWLGYLEGQEDCVKYFHLCIPYAVACYNNGEYERAGLLLRDCETFVPNPVTKYYLAHYDFVKGGTIIKDYCTDIPKEQRGKALAYIASFPDLMGVFTNKKLYDAVEWALYSAYVGDAVKRNIILSIARQEGKRAENYLKELLISPSKLGFNLSNISSVALYALLMRGCNNIPVVVEGLFYNLRLPKELPLMLQEQTALALSVMGARYVLSDADALSVIDEGTSLGLVITQRKITAPVPVVAAYLARLIKDESELYALFNVDYSQVADFAQQLV